MCDLSQPTLKYESFAGHKYLCIADVRCCADVRIWFTLVHTCRANLCKYWKDAPPPLVAKNRAWGWSLEGYSGIQRHLFLLDISISSEMHCTVDGLRILHQFEWSSWSKPKALYKHTFTVCLLVKLVLIGVWASLRLDQVFGIGTLCMCCWQDYLSYHSLSKSTCPKICNLETIWCLATCSID